MKDQLNIGVIASSGGSTIITAYEIFNAIYPDQINMFVATDRKCGIEDYCEKKDIPCQHFNEKNRVALSQKIADYFKAQGGVDIAMLFFLRLITSELFSTFPTMNTHPSLLPAFKGFNPIERAMDEGVSEIGATLHMADDRVDGGNIVAQTVFSITPDVTVDEVHSLSFCQKTYLALWLFWMMHEELISFEAHDVRGFDPIFTINKGEFMPETLKIGDMALEKKISTNDRKSWIQTVAFTIRGA